MVNVFLVRPTGKFPRQTEIWKGSPIFPVGTFRMKIRLPFTHDLQVCWVSYHCQASWLLAEHNRFNSNNKYGGFTADRGFYQCPCCCYSSPVLEIFLTHSCSLYLRASFCKYRESGDSFKIFTFFIFCPNKAFSELFSKTQLKDPKALQFFQNRGKFENRHFGLPPTVFEEYHK